MSFVLVILLQFYIVMSTEVHTHYCKDIASFRMQDMGEKGFIFCIIFCCFQTHIFLKCRNNMKIHDTVNILLTKRIHSFNWDMLILYGYNYYSNKTVLNGYFHLGPRGICVHIFHQILVFLFCSFWTQPCHVILRCMPSQLNLH